MVSHLDNVMKGYFGSHFLVIVSEHMRVIRFFVLLIDPVFLYLSNLFQQSFPLLFLNLPDPFLQQFTAFQLIRILLLLQYLEYLLLISFL